VIANVTGNEVRDADASSLVEAELAAARFEVRAVPRRGTLDTM